MQRMPSVRLFLFAAGLFVASYTGCTAEEEPGIQSVTVTSTGATTVGAGSPCHLGAPDGRCVPALETQDCPDCRNAAYFNDRCTDDGTCDIGGENSQEDCSCDDCFFKAAGCQPDAGNCDDDDGQNICTADEACTCSDCDADPFCTSNCRDDGVCVELYEGCGCADCAANPPENCGGNPTTTTAASTSSAGGAGGAGGATSATTGSGGMGGAGGAGGAGGT